MVKVYGWYIFVMEQVLKCSPVRVTQFLNEHVKPNGNDGY